jgi:hypothetical protein
MTGLTENAPQAIQPIPRNIPRINIETQAFCSRLLILLYNFARCRKDAACLSFYTKK